MRTGRIRHLWWQLPLYALAIYFWFDIAAQALDLATADWRR